MNITVYFDNKYDRSCESLSLVVKVKNAVKAALEYMNFPYDCEVSLTFCNDDYIRGLNSKFRHKDVSTDVLSFPLNDFRAGDVPDEDLTELGDIVINLARAKVQAAEVGNSYEKEVSFLAVHSTLHLLGLDHERSEEEDEFVCELQREIMKNLDF